MKFALRALGIAALVPLLNLAFLLANNLPQGLSTSNLTDALSLEFLLLSSTLHAVTRGRYPTLVEMRAISTAEALSSLDLIWLIAVLATGLSWATLRRLASFLKLQRRKVFWLLGALSLFLALWLFLMLISTPVSIQIEVNAAVPIGPLSPHAHGFSQGGEVEMQTPGYFERAMQKLSPLEPKIIRIDHIYDYYHVYQLDDAGMPRYDWMELDRIIDAILSNGAEPLICLSYMPSALAHHSVYGPPSDYARWEELVYQTVHHLNTERALNIRYWEVWNEPNLPHFWDGTLDEYLRLYEATARGAIRADSSIWLGGPATASLTRSFNVGAPFYEQNWVSELIHYTQAQHLPFHFLSWHYYDSNYRNYAWSVHAHQNWAAALDPPPQLLLTEWNWSGAPAPQLDSNTAAIHAAAVIDTLSKTPLEQAFFFEPIDNSLQPQGRWGLMYADGTDKPVYGTFQLASMLVGEQVAVQSNHPEAGALATKNSGDLTIMVWYAVEQQAGLPITVSVLGLPPSKEVNVSIYTTNPSYSEPSLIKQYRSHASAEGKHEINLEASKNGVELIELTISNE